MDKHTPGPWIIRGVSQEDGSISFGSEKFRIIIGYVTNAASIGDFVQESLKRGTFGSPDAAHTQWANARLCTAAPDLLEALQLLAADVKDYPAWQRPCHALDKALAAIAKATATAA